jgi:SMC interacting uncharacterized protein involved in chromosome segregation
MKKQSEEDAIKERIDEWTQDMDESQETCLERVESLLDHLEGQRDGLKEDIRKRRG